jgi:LuxR family maltose regulon positive regulatory protein
MGDAGAVSRLGEEVIALLSDQAYARHLPLIAQEAYRLSLARVALSAGDLDRAQALLDDVAATVTPGRRVGRLVEVHTLRALVELQRHAGTVSTAAIADMIRALELAEPEGMLLLVLEEGRSLVPVLRAVVQRPGTTAPVRSHAEKLLMALGEEQAPAPGTAPHQIPVLIEPLTPRETEVLELIAAGDTNQAIADELFVTVRTVKKHVSNILGKLRVSNRTQAALRARELRLLDAD